jgi:hypothetical protein
MTEEVKELAGGTLSLQIGSNGESSSNLATEDSGSVQIKHTGKTHTLNGVGGEASETSAQSIEISSDYSETLAKTGSVMSTLRTTGGTSNFEGKDARQLLVDTPDGTVSLQVAELLGHVTKDMNGNYSDVVATDSNEATHTDNLVVDSAPNFNDEVEASVSELIGDIGEGTTLSVLSQIASRGQLDEDGNLGGHLDLKGMDDMTATRVNEVVNAVMPEMQGQVNDFLMFDKDMSQDDLEDFSRWFWSEASEAKSGRSQALTKHFSDRDMSGYTEMLEHYKTHKRYNK